MGATDRGDYVGGFRVKFIAFALIFLGTISMSFYALNTGHPIFATIIIILLFGVNFKDG